jgi:hypothetical protein
MGQTLRDVLIRLRGEGKSAVVMAVPQSVRAELLWKAGDMLVVRAEAGEMRARKVELIKLQRAPTPGEVRADDTTGD